MSVYWQCGNPSRKTGPRHARKPRWRQNGAALVTYGLLGLLGAFVVAVGMMSR